METIKLKTIQELIDKKDLYEFHAYLEFNNIDINTIPKDRLDPLTYAIETHSSEAILQFLIEKYHTLNYETIDGKIPIYCAIEQQNFKLSDYMLLKVGRSRRNGGKPVEEADLNYINRQHQTILEYLCHRKKLTKKTLYYCIQRGVKINGPWDNGKNSILIQIIDSHPEGYEEIIRLLFRNVIYTNEFIIHLITLGKTNHALRRQEIQKLLDEEKSKINITKKVYKSVIDHGCVNLLHLLFNHDIHFNIETKTFDILEGYGLLLRALLYNQYDIVNYLIQYGINKNKVYKNNFTPLTYAAYTHLDQVKFLVERGADINVVDGYGHTPLMIASGYGKLDTIRYLVEQGADLHMKNYKGFNALLISAKYGEFDTMKYLVEQGAQLHEKNNKGDDAFLLCLRHNNLDMVKYLLDQGADINIKDKKGYNALMLSSYFGYFDLVEYLIEQGISLYETDEEGLNAVDYATKGEHMAIVQYLVRYMKEHPEESKQVNVDDTDTMEKNSTIKDKDPTNNMEHDQSSSSSSSSKINNNVSCENDDDETIQRKMMDHNQITNNREHDNNDNNSNQNNNLKNEKGLKCI